MNDAGASPYLALRRARGERDAAIAECLPLAASQAEDRQTKESDSPAFPIKGEGTFPPLPLMGENRGEGESESLQGHSPLPRSPGQAQIVFGTIEYTKAGHEKWSGFFGYPSSRR